MARRVSVAWRTTETREYDTVIEVPDEMTEDELDDYLTNGNCPELIAAEEHHNPFPVSFTRETESFTVLPDTGSPAAHSHEETA